VKVWRVLIHLGGPHTRIDVVVRASDKLGAYAMATAEIGRGDLGLRERTLQAPYDVVELVERRDAESEVE